MFAIDKDNVYRELIQGVNIGIADDSYLFFNCFNKPHIGIKLTAVTTNRFPSGLNSIYLLMDQSLRFSIVTVRDSDSRVIGLERLYSSEGIWTVEKTNEGLFLSAVYRKLKEKGISVKEFVDVYSDTNAGVELITFPLKEMELLLQKQPEDQFYPLDSE